MIIEQIVEVPANHRLVLDLPPEIPEGRVKATLTLETESSPSVSTAFRQMPEDMWKERAEKSFLLIEKLRKKARPDFDYKKELEAARDEKYARLY
jgi:hypothetical protein